MPLHIMVEDVANSAELCYVRDDEGEATEMAAVTKAIGFHAMWCDFRDVTAENVKDVWARIHFYETLNGPILEGPDGPVALTEEQVKAHVGLRTNCTERPFAEFAQRITALWVSKIGGSPMQDEIQTELEAAYDDDAPIMLAAFGIIRERQTLTDEMILNALQDEDFVSDGYWEVMHPAIERLERRARAAQKASVG